MYDHRKGKNWTFDAPIFGIPSGPRHISVHIVLPDDYPIVPDGYRQFLRYAQGEQPNVLATDFAEIVRDNRPEWLIELIRSLAPDSASSDDIRNELQNLLNNLRVRRVSPRVTLNGATNVANGSGSAVEPDPVGSKKGGGNASRQKPTDLSVLPNGAKRADLFKNVERAPEIILLHDEQEIEDNGIKGRAARFVMEPNQLFINMNYPSIAEIKSILEAEYADAPDPEVMRTLVKQHAERTMILRVGRTVVYALAKQLSKEWDQKALGVASSPESLSMAADDFADALQNVRRDIGRKLRTSKNTDAGSVADQAVPAAVN